MRALGDAVGPSAVRPVVPGDRLGTAAANGARRVMDADLDHVMANAGTELGRMAGGRILITGGAGFLGYYLVQAILRWSRDHSAKIDVTVYDNYARGVPAWIQQLSTHRELELVEHDVRHPLPDTRGAFTYVIHAAGIASPTYYRKHPIDVMDANVMGLRHLLDQCKRQQEEAGDLQGLLYFSSSEIYGDPLPGNIPTRETYRGNVSCTGPRACYDESKRFGETLCVNFAQQYGLPLRIVRPFNNYGPGLKITDRRVIPDFACDILAGRDIVLLSDGTPTRTFCYVADAVVGYFKALVRGRSGEAYNIGVDGPEVSMWELAEMMADVAGELFGYEGKTVRRPPAEAEYLVDNPSRRCPSIEKARSELGYEPSISLQEGLRRSLIWYAENMDPVPG